METTKASRAWRVREAARALGKINNALDGDHARRLAIIAVRHLAETTSTGQARLAGHREESE